MMFMPMAIWIGHPSLTVGLYIWKGVLPVLLGNIVGGSLFCGLYHHLMYYPLRTNRSAALTAPKGDLEMAMSLSPASEEIRKQGTVTSSDARSRQGS